MGSLYPRFCKRCGLEGNTPRPRWGDRSSLAVAARDPARRSVPPCQAAARPSFMALDLTGSPLSRTGDKQFEPGRPLG